MRSIRHLSTSLVIAVCALLVAPLASVPAAAQQYCPQSSDSYTVQQEIQIGQQAAAETMKKYPVLPDNSPVTQYVARLGRRLTQYAPGEKWPYSFHVVNSKEINAFALPGGPLFVNIGAIQAASNEAQLAGVMAHEISHDVCRHATRMATSQAKWSVPVGILGAILGARGGVGGTLAQAAVQFGAEGAMLHFSRKDESQADAQGAKIMYDAGYNPMALAQFFEKLEEESGTSSPPQFLSDHPNPGNRADAIEKEIAQWPQKQYTSNTPEFDQIKRMVQGQGLSAQQIANGQRGGNRSSGGAPPSSEPADVRASGQWQTFQHGMYTIQYPSNWQVFGDQQSDVTIAPQGGVGQTSDGQSAVAYGVMISMYQTEPRTNNPLDDATHELIDQLHQANPDMRQIGNDEDIRVNGQAGKSVEFRSKSPIQGQNERDWLVTVKRPDGNISYLVFIAPERDFNQLSSTFNYMLRTFHVR